MQVVLHDVKPRTRIRLNEASASVPTSSTISVPPIPISAVELTAEGEIVVMPPTGAETGY